MSHETLNILIIHDSEAHLSNLSKALVSFPKTEIQTQSIDKFSDEIMSNNQYDLILLNFHAKSQLFEAINILQANPSLSTSPIIAISEALNEQEQTHILDQSINEYIDINSSVGIFKARIRTQIRHSHIINRLNQISIDRELFAAGVIHDIRNIETTIRTVCELNTIYLSKDPEGKKEKFLKNLESLTATASKLRNYANNVISSVKQSQKVINLKPTDLKKILSWSTDIIVEKSNQGISPITWNSDCNLQNVYADEDFLRLALFNLIQNSVKYTPAGNEVRLEVKQREETKDQLITTCIRDFGQGVTEQDLKKIFKPFTKTENKSKSGGFGLGLSMVAKVIKEMGGQVWAELPEDNSPGLVICIQLKKA